MTMKIMQVSMQSSETAMVLSEKVEFITNI